MANCSQVHTVYKFVAKTENITTIMRTLQVINFREYATFHVSEGSMKVTVEESRCVQSTAYINALVFQEYVLRVDDEDDSDEIAFKINLNHVVTCLKVHSKNGASLRMSYKGHGFPFELLIEENGVVTDCNLKTFPPDDLVRFTMNPDTHDRLTISCDLMKMAVREIDPTSEIVEIGLHPTAPNLTIVSAGAGGEGIIEMDQADGTFKTFQCPLDVKASFKLCLLKNALKPLLLFQTCCLRLDEEGLLRLQYMTNSPNMRHCVAEFYVTPILE